MEERRRAPRIKEENEVTITNVSGENNIPQGEIIDDHFKDISVCGARIKTNILLPEGTILEIDFTSKGVQQKMNILGKVKWGKVIQENESYELGVEFYPSKEIEILEDYISLQLKSDKSEIIKDKVSPIDVGDINIVETKKVPPIKNKQWTKIAIISTVIIILIVVLLVVLVPIPLDYIYAPTNKKVTNNIVHDSMTTKSETLPATPVAVPEPSPAPAPAPEVTQKIKVIGNSDSKIYHLPGMKYYDAVKAYHRVEFDSENDAVKAGYSKAPK